MAITISGENNNDRILAADGVIDQISGINFSGIITASHINVGSNIQLGNAGIITATTFVGNLTGNVNSTSPLLLQTGGSERFRITGNNELGIAGANYGSSGQVLTSGGSGSAVSWTTIPTQVTIANNAVDRVITGGSGTNLNGEAYLTFSHTSNNGLDVTRTNANTAAMFRGHGGAGTIGLYDTTNAKLLFLSNSNGDFNVQTSDGSYAKKLTVKQNGLVGINTSSPASPGSYTKFLEVSDNNAASIIVSRSASGTAHKLEMGAFSGASLIESTGATSLRFKTNSTERLRIDSDGNIWANYGNPQSSSLMILDKDGSGEAAIRFYNAGANKAKIALDNDEHLTFDVNNSERLRIDSNGNIGVNCTPSTSGTLYDTVDHFLVIGDNDTGIAQDGDGQFEIWANQQEIINFSTAGIDPKKSILPNQAINIGQTSLPISHIYSTNITLDSSLIHNGDTDTKIEFTNNQIDLQCAGASRAYINNYALYMAAGFPVAFLATSGATPNIKSGGTNNQDLLFTTGTGNPTRLQITSGGVVHIGSTAVSNTIPTGGLDLQGNNTNCILEMGNPLPNYSAGRVPTFRITTTDADKKVDFSSMWGGDNGIWKHMTLQGGATIFYNGTNDTEIVRITGSALMVGTTSNSSSTQAKGISLNNDGAMVSRRDGVMHYYKSISTGGYYANVFLSANTTVGSIFFNSGGTQFNTSSDYRRKENVVSLTDGISKIKQLKPYRFNFKDNPSETVDGFLAHEAQEIVPHTVTGTKDQVSTSNDVAVGIATTVGEPIYQQMDLSKLVPLLTAALQDEISKREALEARVAALESS